jgi:hypothetical protein
MEMLESCGRTIEQKNDATYRKARRFGIASIPNPPAWLGRSLRHDREEGAVRQLPDASLTECEQQALALIGLAGLSTRQAGKLLGRDNSTVYRAYLRALRRLRDYMKSHNVSGWEDLHRAEEK